jgi:hypothetical protein
VGAIQRRGLRPATFNFRLETSSVLAPAAAYASISTHSDGGSLIVHQPCRAPMPG